MTIRACSRAARVLLALAMASAAAAPLQAQDAVFDRVAERARQLAAEPHRAPQPSLPAELAALNYDGHRDIRFRPERALWRGDGLPFEVQFFHPGWLFADPVRIHEVTPQGMREITVAPEDFDYGRNRLDP
ncbi:MAG: glucan biosynthesis protein, partial [Betaproteobacteria bacterium]